MRSMIRVCVVSFVSCAMVLSLGTAWAMPSNANSSTNKMKGDLPDYMTTIPFEFPPLGPYQLGPYEYKVSTAIGTGFMGDYVRDRSLDDVSDLEVRWFGGEFFYDPIDRLHANVFVGAAEVRWGTVALNESSTTKAELETVTDVAVGVSGKLDVYEWPLLEGNPPLLIFVTAGYRWMEAPVNTAKKGNIRDAAQLDMKVQLHEWQGGLGIAQRIDNFEALGKSLTPQLPDWWPRLELPKLELPPLELPDWWPRPQWPEWQLPDWWPRLPEIPWGVNAVIPYVGMKYSDVDAQLSGTAVFPPEEDRTTESVTAGDRGADDVLGMFVGTELYLFNERVSAGVEGRFIDETALQVSARMRW